MSWESEPEVPEAEWIDTHTHLDHEYPFSVEEYLDNARKQGVTAFVTIGTEAGELSALRDLAEKHQDVYFTVGVHPHEASTFGPEAESAMTGLRTHPKCLAVGEIGLDFHYNYSTREDQRKALRRQLALALEWGKPVVIHAREAEAELLEDLAPFAHALKRPGGPGVIHCFTGTLPFAQECLKLGFFISFSGIVTFKKADDLRNVVREVPLDRLLLETDSPYLAPIPYRGKPNQSAYLIETAKAVAAVKGLDLAALSAATVANSRRLFGLGGR